MFEKEKNNIQREEIPLTYKQKLGLTAVKFLCIGVPIATAIGGVLWVKGDDFAVAGAGRLEPSVQTAGNDLNASLQESKDELEAKVDTALVTVTEARCEIVDVRRAFEEFLIDLGYEPENDDGTVPTTTIPPEC